MDVSGTSPLGLKTDSSPTSARTRSNNSFGAESSGKHDGDGTQLDVAVSPPSKRESSSSN